MVSYHSGPINTTIAFFLDRCAPKGCKWEIQYSNFSYKTDALNQIDASRITVTYLGEKNPYFGRGPPLNEENI